MKSNSRLVEPGNKGLLEGNSKRILTYTDSKTNGKAGETSIHIEFHGAWRYVEYKRNKERN